VDGQTQPYICLVAKVRKNDLTGVVWTTPLERQSWHV